VCPSIVQEGNRCIDQLRPFTFEDTETWQERGAKKGLDLLDTVLITDITIEKEKTENDEGQNMILITNVNDDELQIPAIANPGTTTDVTNTIPTDMIDATGIGLTGRIGAIETIGTTGGTSMKRSHTEEEKSG
jgi:hypothetical protein